MIQKSKCNKGCTVRIPHTTVPGAQLLSMKTTSVICVLFNLLEIFYVPTSKYVHITHSLFVTQMDVQ